MVSRMPAVKPVAVDRASELSSRSKQARESGPWHPASAAGSSAPAAATAAVEARVAAFATPAASGLVPSEPISWSRRRVAPSTAALAAARLISVTSARSRACCSGESSASMTPVVAFSPAIRSGA